MNMKTSNEKVTMVVGREYKMLQRLIDHHGNTTTDMKSARNVTDIQVESELVPITM